MKRTRHQHKVELMLDSGAFTAWKNQEQIDLDAYIDFALEHIDVLSYVVNLDVIPGQWGKATTAKDARLAASEGWANYQYMLECGVPKEKLIHVFHQGDGKHWLELFMREGLEYIGLSPANDKTTAQKIQWLDSCMPYVTDANGYPRNKWHGFAVTSLRIMLRYPWYSVDSTTWVVLSRHGVVLVPRYKNGHWIYDEDSWKISVSNRSNDQREKGKHFITLSKKEREIVQRYFDAKGYCMGASEFRTENANYTPEDNERWIGKAKNDQRQVERIITEGLCNSHHKRDAINMQYFIDLEDALPKYPWSIKQTQITNGFGL